jgi:hypothetical protein
MLWLSHCSDNRLTDGCTGRTLLPRNIIFLHLVFISWGSCTLFIWTGGGARFSSCGECDVDPLGSGSFCSPFLNEFRIAARLVCSSCEAMAGSLSVASTAVSSEKVAVIYSDETGRSAVYSRYIHGARTLHLVCPH